MKLILTIMVGIGILYLILLGVCLKQITNAFNNTGTTDRSRRSDSAT